MIRRLKHLLRIAGTACGFIYFALACLALSYVIIPIVALRDDPEKSREVRAQRWVGRMTYSFFVLIDVMGCAELKCSDLERLRRPGQFIVANHPTLIDAIAFMALMHQIDVVVKAGHGKNFVLGGVIRGAGYIPNASGPALVNESVSLLEQGRSVVIFPEGTRSEPHGLNLFGRGAAHVAIRSGLDPLPVTIRCEPATLYRGRSWWEIPDRKISLTLDVGEPIALSEILTEPMPTPRAARAVTAALTAYFERRLELVG